MASKWLERQDGPTMTETGWKMFERHQSMDREDDFFYPKTLEKAHNKLEDMHARFYLNQDTIRDYQIEIDKLKLEINSLKTKIENDREDGMTLEMIKRVIAGQKREFDPMEMYS